MGPADGNLSEMSSTSKALSLPKLCSDSSNWATYSERILNYMTSKGYRRHVLGTACKPEVLIERSGVFYKPGMLNPMSDEDLEKHEEMTDLFDQMQTAVCEVIYRTVDKTTFLQIKNEGDAASIWKKVVSIYADKRTLFEANLLVQLQNMCYNEKESMREHIGKMTEIRECLAEMNAPISDEHPLFPISRPHSHSPHRFIISSVHSVQLLIKPGRNSPLLMSSGTLPRKQHQSRLRIPSISPTPQ